MNDNSKKCFTELTKICILYSNIAKISMDESLNNVLSTLYQVIINIFL